jgi:hypothetical protein
MTPIPPVIGKGYGQSQVQRSAQRSASEETDRTRSGRNERFKNPKRDDDVTSFRRSDTSAGSADGDNREVFLKGFGIFGKARMVQAALAFEDRR